jgi:signal transduction histidine kinase
MLDASLGLVEALEEEKKRGGLGLTSMRERATEPGGTCLVESSPQGGTRVYARLPCRQETDGQK